MIIVYLMTPILICAFLTAACFTYRKSNKFIVGVAERRRREINRLGNELLKVNKKLELQIELVKSYREEYIIAAKNRIEKIRADERAKYNCEKAPAIGEAEKEAQDKAKIIRDALGDGIIGRKSIDETIKHSKELPKTMQPYIISEQSKIYSSGLVQPQNLIEKRKQ